GPPPANPAAAIAPESDALIGLTSGCTGAPASIMSKYALPMLLVAHGPVNRSYSSTGRSGTASSSSCLVGCRCSFHWFGCQPPIEVIHCPGGTVLRRSASASCTSLI